MATVLRIHGDNIIECERALRLIAQSLALESSLVASPIYFPRYALTRESFILFYVDLMAGHGRWNLDLQNILCENGAPLREATDAVVTNLATDGKETLLLALEFSSALPAGNNAWQRHGRALTCATVGLPYLYFAEIGGIELGKERSVKASRFPNPIVPFAYLAAEQLFDTICIPVYSPSPTSSEAFRTEFSSAFGEAQGVALIRALLTNSAVQESYAELRRRGLRMTELLAMRRRHADTWHEKEWAEFLAFDTVRARTTWLPAHSKAWRKKSGAKVRTSQTFEELRNIFSSAGCFMLGGGDMPICWLAANNREQVGNGLAALYAKDIPSTWKNWLSARDEPLFVVWVTGFKPEGEDSRPDRGLLPLLRMLVGYDADVLTIVSGPAKAAMWEQLRQSPQRLAQQNGLWEAILNLSNAVLADSATLSKPIWLVRDPLTRPLRKKISFIAAAPPKTYSEQDVDTALHLLLSQPTRSIVHEGLCNPPGGDWSGLSLIDWQTRTEYRWTSLPRVSGKDKRPDHVTQFHVGGRDIVLAIESKTRANQLEPRVGPRLGAYVQKLIRTFPTAIRHSDQTWRVAAPSRFPLENVETISGGAFCGVENTPLTRVAQRCELEAVFAFEFRSGEQPSLLRVFLGERAEFLLPILRELAGHLPGQLEIDVG